MTDHDVAALFPQDPKEAERRAVSRERDAAVYAPVPLEVRDVVLDPAFARRRDALLRTVPVHDVAVRASTGPGTFDVRALILAAFDAVIARQGFPDRTTPDQVVTLLAGIAAVQDPRASAAACHGVADRVLDGLTNRRERERQFTLPASVYLVRPDGGVASTSVSRPFWLLREVEDSRTGSTCLECSIDAVNTLVGGLDVVIEDQQEALEIILGKQLVRGDLDAAHATAVQARRLTAGYLIKVEELLAETDRDVRGTDWNDAAPRLINDALLHITECLTREGRLLEHVAAGADPDARTAADMSAERRTKVSATLTRLLSESRHLHTVLMDRLIGARGRFLDAQDNQMFRVTIPTITRDLRDDLLEPALGLHLADVEQVAAAYLRGALGPQPPVALDWGDFLAALVQAPVAAGPPAEPDEAELELRPDPEPLVSRDLLVATQDILAKMPLPARLSTLLACCPVSSDSGAAPTDLLVAAGLRAYDNSARDTDPDPDPGPRRGAIGRHAVMADSFDDAPLQAPAAAAGPVQLLEILGPDAVCFDDGVELDGASWSGADLIVCADRDQFDGIVLGDLTAPVPTPLPPTLRHPATATHGRPRREP